MREGQPPASGRAQRSTYISAASKWEQSV